MREKYEKELKALREELERERVKNQKEKLDSSISTVNVKFESRLIFTFRYNINNLNYNA
jgi:hypothetical protein